MKYCENLTPLYFTWEQVAQAFWKRYPNPQSTHVLSEDTISRSVIDGKLHTKRLLIKTKWMPKWAKRITNVNVEKIIEESIVDPKEKVITTYTRNIGMVRILKVAEKVTYNITPGNSNWTDVRRSVWFDSPLRTVGGIVVSYCSNRFRKQCVNTIKGFNHVLVNMFPKTAALSPEAASDSTSKTDKLRDAAKLAKDLAQSKATSMFASCEANEA